MKTKLAHSVAPWVVGVSLLLPAPVIAQPSITDPFNGGPWDNLEAHETSALVFETSLVKNTQTAEIEILVPGGDAPAHETRLGDSSGTVCDNATSCSGINVSYTYDIANSRLRIHLEPADVAMPFTSNLWISLRTTGAPGTWDLCPDTLAMPPTACAVPGNFGVHWAHAIPAVDVTYPGAVPSKQQGVILDATASAVVFKKIASSSQTPPAINAYNFGLVDPAQEACKNLISGSGTTLGTASVDAIDVTTPRDCHITVAIDDNTGLSAATIATINVQLLAQPADVVLAIDTSGSMGWHRSGSAHDMQGKCCSRLAAAKFAATSFVDRLGLFANDSRVGVAIFPGEPAPSSVYGKRWSPVPIPSTGLAPTTDFNAVKLAIGDTQTCPLSCDPAPTKPIGTVSIGSIPVNWNGTPTRAGLEAARTMLASSTPASRRKVIVLLSDGAHNIGGTPEDTSFLQPFVADNIHIYTVGVGTGTDNINFQSLQDISSGTGVGIPSNPVGFATFDTDSPVTSPNLVPLFEKILTDVVDQSFTTDPAATIDVGDTHMRKILVTGHDSLLSFTVSWEATVRDALDVHVLSPGGRQFEPQTSAGGYKSITISERILREHGNIGEWQLVVHYPQAHSTAQPHSLTYNYSIIPKSTLQMRILTDKAKYVTGNVMTLEARLLENNRRLPGAIVDVHVTRPKSAIGNWHFVNVVAENILKTAPDEISGEPLSRLDKKNYVLLQKNHIRLPGTEQTPTFTLNDAGVTGDGYARDGIYGGRFSGFTVPGIYKFHVIATGTARNGEAYRRELEFQKFVDIIPDAGTTDSEAAVINRKDGNQRIVRVSVTPFDAAKNYLGPGYGDELDITLASGEPQGAVTDMLYGAYQRQFAISQAALDADPQVTIKARNVLVYEDSYSGLVQRRYTWGISAHLGASMPLQTMSNRYRRGASGMLDLAYHIDRAWTAELLLGKHNFDDKTGVKDFTWSHASINAKYSYPVGLFRVYGNGGFGWYEPGSGDSSRGWNAGAGIIVPLSETLSVELGYNRHRVDTPDFDKFSTLSLGVEFGFK